MMGASLSMKYNGKGLGFTDWKFWVILVVTMLCVIAGLDIGYSVGLVLAYGDMGIEHLLDVGLFLFLVGIWRWDLSGAHSSLDEDVRVRLSWALAVFLFLVFFLGWSLLVLILLLLGLVVVARIGELLGAYAARDFMPGSK